MTSETEGEGKKDSEMDGEVESVQGDLVSIRRQRKRQWCSAVWKNSSCFGTALQGCDEGSRRVREAAAKPQRRLVVGRDSSGAFHVRATP